MANFQYGRTVIVIIERDEDEWFLVGDIEGRFIGRYLFEVKRGNCMAYGKNYGRTDKYKRVFKGYLKEKDFQSFKSFISASPYSYCYEIYCEDEGLYRQREMIRIYP